MADPPDMADRHARVLARLTELGLALAERTFEDAEAAETPAERIEAVKAFHTISRSVRQCVALEARLARQQALDAREAAAAPPRKPSGVERYRRLNTVSDAVTRVIWHEAETDDTAAWLEETFEEGLSRAFTRDDFCDEPLDDHIARLCLQMGLPEEAALNWRDLPEPPEPDPIPDDDDLPADEALSPPPDTATSEPRPQSSA